MQQGRTYYIIIGSNFYSDASTPGDQLAFKSVEQLQECRDALKDAREHIWCHPDNPAPDPQSFSPLSQAPKSHQGGWSTEAQARDDLDDRIQRVERVLAERKKA